MDRASRFTRQLPQVVLHGAEMIKIQWLYNSGEIRAPLEDTTAIEPQNTTSRRRQSKTENNDVPRH